MELRMNYIEVNQSYRRLLEIVLSVYKVNPSAGARQQSSRWKPSGRRLVMRQVQTSKTSSIKRQNGLPTQSDFMDVNEASDCSGDAFGPKK
jgi:hypothetical protein